MSELSKVIEEHVNSVASDIEDACGYQLNNVQKDELEITGRVSIEIKDLAPYFKALNNFVKAHHLNWSLTLNTISGDFEIELKGCHLLF
ncbi:hypothetical protein [Limosilactobacillus panis]|uniref:Uncharacterized protein n=1 Tax=Limosilactobacillus panis TaxID=47493 RepID=A0ABT7VRY1_9LACO|nr:hypothetical protein [Limosilactobacillus panis]MDM8334764.1 hypothetical protein [Limosilactobacillus panis]